MAEKTLTTGQVTGLTGIPLHTLQRYVRDFESFLSPEARKHTQGRRFTLADVKYIFWIRHLYFQRWPPADIRAVLSGDKTCETLPQFDILDDLSISQATRDYMTAAQASAKQASSAARRAEGSAESISHIIDRFKKDQDQRAKISRLESQITNLKDEIEKLKIQVMKKSTYEW